METIFNFKTMSPNNQNRVIPGRVRALTNQWQAGVPFNPQQTNLTMLDALPDRNCSLAAQSVPGPVPGPVLATAINRWEDRRAPTPAQQTLQLFGALPDVDSSLVPQSFPSNVVVRAPTRSTSFAFSSLPPEIRLMIWNLLIPRAKNIRLTNNRMKHSRSHSRQIPPILHVNYESRTVALRHLTRLFGGINGNGYPEQFLYFNPSLDTVCFDGGVYHSFEFPHTILPPGTDPNYQAPLAETDNVVAIQIDENQVMYKGPARHFRNLELVIVQSSFSWSAIYPSNTAGRQSLARRTHSRISSGTAHIRDWFQRRFDAGLISRVPRIQYVLTWADARAHDSLGQWVSDYYRANPF
ncbi:hypothetical protein BELL_0120g00140 [Botrytis elliptica]|uniref:2EXR domain-containing protein n=1 Tax=Botrytis elliptica TaxID=278938 RepID=A0A4Z1JTL5_9HELO|nr:hypothetical protein BELL_0120g00140 [Botrytis elliptica]